MRSDSDGGECSKNINNSFVFVFGVIVVLVQDAFPNGFVLDDEFLYGPIHFDQVFFQEEGGSERVQDVLDDAQGMVIVDVASDQEQF